MQREVAVHHITRRNGPRGGRNSLSDRRRHVITGLSQPFQAGVRHRGNFDTTENLLPVPLVGHKIPRTWDKVPERASNGLCHHDISGLSIALRKIVYLNVV